jgi:hypothetical protein
MGGKAHADNSAIVKEQKKQSDDAVAKEAKRQARLDSGLSRINRLFDGTPVTAATTHNFDWKNFNDKTKLPAGYTRVQVDAKGKPIAGTPAKAATTGGVSLMANAGDPGYGGSAGTASIVPPHAAVAAAPAVTGTTMIKGPDGKLHKIGSALTYSTNDPTGKTTGGFDDAFYDTYKNSITDYYDPQVADQYKKATDELTYRLARAGTSVSSAGDTQVADLAKQNTDNLVGIANKADTAVAAKKADVANAKSKAISQLYATENPDVAANQATAAVRDISPAATDLSPLAQLFNIAAVGGANIYKGYNNQNLIGSFQSGLPKQQGSGNIIT